MDSCLHGRRWFYRTKFFAKHPVLVVERCQDCHENVRGEGAYVPRSEVIEAGLMVGLLSEDPWPGGRHG